MGQRTQLILQQIDKKGNQRNIVYHFQFGFGRVMYFQFLELYYKAWNKCLGHDEEPFNEWAQLGYNDVVADSSKPRKEWDPLQKIYIDRPAPHWVKNIDVNSEEQIQRLINDHCDNNNGVMVIQVMEAEGKYRLDEYLFRIGFMLGDEDTYGTDREPFRYITPRQYAELGGGRNYSDETFRKMIDAILEFGDDIEILKSNNE